MSQTNHEEMRSIFEVGVRAIQKVKWQMACESNEPRGNAKHFRGGRSCYSFAGEIVQVYGASFTLVIGR